MENQKKKNHDFIVTLNLLGLLGIAFSLIVAFYYQFFHHELPCPLCLLQRIGLMAAGMGFLFNIYQSVRYSHYAMTILASLVFGAVATRQIFLHILPNDLGYGSSLFGFHFYTWVFIAAILLIVTVLGVIVLSELTSEKEGFISLCWLKPFVPGLFVCLIIANILSTFLQCGFSECPDDPIKYLFL